MCVGEVLPATETLNGIDDDCNGTVDDGVTPPPPVPALVVSTTAVTVAENSTTTFAVNLSAQPAANVLVTVSSGDTGAATVNPSFLTFTPANYSTPQSVTVTGVPDADTANEGVTVTVSSVGMTTRTVSVSVIDDDGQAIVASLGSSSVCQGDITTASVSLQFSPGGSATVTVTPSARVDVVPSALTFTAANFAIAQFVDVGGLSPGSATIRLSTPGAPDHILSLTVLAITSPACSL
jgi:hypothetical protein